MKATLRRTWQMLDHTKPVNSEESKIDLAAGEYELERISNPYGYEGNWLVLKGTSIGAGEGFWRQWKNGEIINNPNHPDHGKPVDWKEFEIVIEEDSVTTPAMEEWCVNAAEHLFAQIDDQWKDFAGLEIAQGSTVSAMGQQPSQKIFEILRQKGCEVRQNPANQSGWEVRR